MSTFDLLADLPVTIEGYSLEGLRAEVSSGFERLSTVVHLHGQGHTGVGEDVVHDGVDQEALQAAGQAHDLAGTYALGELCERIDGLDLFPVAPQRDSPGCTGAGRSTARRSISPCGRPTARCTTCSGASRNRSRSLSRSGSGATALDLITHRLERYATLRFKLDPTSSWTPELIAALVDTGAVDSVDFKSLYRGTVVDQPPDPVLYERVVSAFPQAWIEDPDVVTPETAAVLEPYHDRITWDAPIHSIDDIESLPFPPRMVNIKPSRIGGLKKLCDAYDYCAERGIGAYGGGQFELGPGRGQAQYLASLFHHDTPNDLAPVGYNENEPPAGLPSSPLPASPSPVGFRWNE